MTHVGIGYDVHQLVAGRKLVLGGVASQPLPCLRFKAIV
jgi:2C-methyl-D-erythritol 2,4-cyclodiphosphate synthase